MKLPKETLDWYATKVPKTGKVDVGLLNAVLDDILNSDCSRGIDFSEVSLELLRVRELELSGVIG